MPDPDLERMRADWANLADYRDAGAPGCTRLAFTEADHDGRHAVAAMMREAGLQVEIDAVGNVIGDLAGTDPNANAIVTGSHTDTVYGGGQFDGMVGVLGAIEAVRVLREAGLRLRHRLRVVDFANEEPNAHGLSCVGSRAVVGNLTPRMLGLPDGDGVHLSARIRAGGWDADRVAECAWQLRDIDAYVELHIEQGPVLEDAGAQVGVVTSIAGIARFVAEISGRRDHAGTMPMDQRLDATCGAAEVVLAVERIAAAGAGTVGTVGEIVTVPDAVNVIAEAASVTGEFRSDDPDWLSGVAAVLDREVAAACRRHRVAARTEWRPLEPPVVMDRRLSDRLTAAAAAAGHESLRLYSGAGHDAVQMARIAPTAMLFVPSVGGRSHCPEESTAFDDIAAGVQTLTRSLLEIDGTPQP